MAMKQEDPELDRTITEIELKKGIKDVINRPGSDAVTHILLYKANPLGHRLILQLLNRCFEIEKLVASWKDADIAPIPKSTTEHRPISLLTCISKLLERIILNRLLYRMTPFERNLYGYQKGVGTQDALATLMHQITRKPKEKTYCIFLDIEKAFELVNKEVILEALVKKGIKGKILKIIDDFLTDRRARVVYQGSYSTYHNLENGTPQGSVLSATLFNIAMNQRIQDINLEGVKILCYADDIVMVATESNKENLQKALNLLGENAEKYCLKISESKTKAMCFNGPQPNHQLRINDIQIEWVKDHKYLGILFDNRLSFNNHVQYILTKCHKRINVMKSLTTINKGAYAKVLITYYVTAVRSLIDYAAPVLTNISQKNMQELQKIQNAAMRIALGAPKWTSIFNMHKETNLLPIKDRIQQINCNIIIKTMFQKPRILSNQISENTISFYIDPILETIKNSGIDINDIVANTNHQDIHTYKPWESVPAELLIKRFVASKKTANHQILSTKYIKYIKEINSNKDLIIYTDGSVDIINQRAGAAAIIRDSKNRTLQTIKRRINNEVSSLQTELVAIALALAETKNLTSLNLVIHTDSMNAILDLRKTEPDSNVSLIKTIQSLTL